MKKNTKITVNNTNYTLIETVGNGGSSEVWKAKSNGIEYAIKFLRLAPNSNEKIIRFENEIAFCKESNHKNIVKLIADGEVNGQLYYIMPLYKKTFRNLINIENDVNVLINFILKLCSALKYIHKKGIFQSKEKVVSKTIQQRASEDILFGKILFHSKSNEELNKYNPNWHTKIEYSVDKFLYNLYIQERIYSACKRKFEYESNSYRRDKWYNVLDLEKNKRDFLLYQQINSILEKYKLSNKGENNYDLSGKILKYFTSCADYHCEEILDNIKNIESSAKRNLKDAPIIQIVYTLKFSIKQNIDFLLSGSVSRHNFNFVEHIDISSRSIDTYLQNHDDLELFDSQYLKEEIKIKEILSEFEKKWKVICYKLNEDEYSVRFRTHKEYEKFRKFALELSENYYIFEGDVIDFLKNPKFIGTMVELKFGAIFDIPHTIAKILGLREINH